MSYFLFLFWLILLSWFLTKIRFVKNAGLNPAFTVFLFVCKVGAGIAAGWLTHNNAHTDTWNYHHQALAEYDLLFSHPKEYLINLFNSGYSYGYSGVLQTQNSYWNDLKDNLIIKFISVLHLFSGGNYYVNVVLYNFAVFFGLIALFRVFVKAFQAGAVITATFVFLLPSVLFYGSTIHKDGIIMALTGAVVFHVWRALESSFSLKRIVYILAALLIIFLFRNYVAMALVPALTAWIIAAKKASPYKVFAAIYAVSLLLFFSIQYVFPRANLPLYVVKKQADFFALEKGNTSIPTDTLQPNFVSFLQAAPQAMQHGFLRPFVTDIKLSRMLLPLSLELIFCQLLVITFFLTRKKPFSFRQPFVLFCLCFAVSMCLIIGYIVPVIGAIVRYRSIYLPFFILPFVAGASWSIRLFPLKIKI